MSERRPSRREVGSGRGGEDGAARWLASRIVAALNVAALNVAALNVAAPIFAAGLIAGQAAGCARHERTPVRPLSTLPAEAGPLDALNRRHSRLRRRMGARGYGEHLGLTRAFVLEERGVALPLDLMAGTCSTFLALAGGSIRDVALRLFDGDGAEAATDSVEGEAGLAHVCPQAEPGVTHRPYYLVVRSLDGAGAVVVAQFHSDPGAGEGFEGLFEGVLAPRVPFRDVEDHLARSRTALRARGFSPVEEPTLERVTEGAVVRLPVELEAGRCYVAIGRSGHGLADIDLFLFDGAGVEVARDLAGDAEPSLEHCPSMGGRHTVELRAFEGAGAVGLAVFGRPRPEEGSEAEGRPVEAAMDERTSAQSATDPSLALGVLAAPLQSRGFAPPLFVSRDASIVPGEVRTHDVVVGPGCALIAGTASDEGMDLDLYLADDSGRELDRDTAVQSTARVRACRDEATVLRVAVKGYGRDGSYALALLRAPAGVDSLQGLRLEEATAPYRLRAYAPRSSLSAELDEGERFRRQIQVRAGACVAAAAAGDDGVDDVDLFMLDPLDELVASDSGPAPYAAVSRCADDTEQLTLDVAMYRGHGSVTIEILQAGPPELEDRGPAVGSGQEHGSATGTEGGAAPARGRGRRRGEATDAAATAGPEASSAQQGSSAAAEGPADASHAGAPAEPPQERPQERPQEPRAD